MRAFIENLGRRVRETVTGWGEMTTMLLLAARSVPDLLRRRLGVVARVAVRQAFFTGNQALLLTSAIGFFLGAIVVVQAVTRFPGLGVEAYLGDVLVIAILRELGPLVATVVVIGRSGTAMAAELASMRVHGEVEDLECMGIDPVQYLFVPRLVGAVTALFGLMVFVQLLALAGGYAVLQLQDSSLQLRALVGSAGRAATLQDLALVPVKAVLYGSMIAIFSCYRGLSAGSNPAEIPRAATRAVVGSLLGVSLADLLLATATYL